MKIAIVGAGIIGVTTAWELVSDGHEVTVFERRGAAAEEASFANAGVVAPGYVTPWAAPGMREGAALAALLAWRHQAALAAGARDLGWMSRWQKACKLETYLANRARMQRLAFYSRTRLHEVSEARELSYERSDGYLVLLRSKREKKLIQPGLEVLRTAGSVFAKSMPTRPAGSSPPSTPTRRWPAPSTCRKTKSPTAASSRCCSSGRPRRSARSFISTATSRR
jgi:D-amino-acid dehydrogenase